jgi:hypothetical protein
VSDLDWEIVRDALSALSANADHRFGVEADQALAAAYTALDSLEARLVATTRALKQIRDRGGMGAARIADDVLAEGTP